MLLPAAEKTISRMTDEVAILVVAGSESPAKTLALIHFHLLNKPSIMLKLRHEVQESIGDSMQIPPLQKLETLPYLSSVIKEGLRMHGGITARSSRVAVDEALQYRQWVIPRGTPLSTSSVFIHRNPDIFPNPSEFIPERWLDSGKLERRLDHYLVAFGKGSRNCVGLNLAFAEMLLALASVVAYFEMDLFMTDVSDVEMVRDWYVPQAKLGSVGVQARVLRRV
jgi:cytochrome P450